MEHKPPFAVEYYHQGKTWALTLWAENWQDAEARLKSIGFNGKVVGSNVQQIRANSVTLPFAFLWVNFICWFRNLGQRK